MKNNIYTGRFEFIVESAHMLRAYNMLNEFYAEKDKRAFI